MQGKVVEIDYECLGCVHNFYETDMEVFCDPSVCINYSNFEEITEEDIELFKQELNIETSEDYLQSVDGALVENLILREYDG